MMNNVFIKIWLTSSSLFFYIYLVLLSIFCDFTDQTITK